MKTPEEILKEFNIRANTKHHSYEYLYNSFIKIISQCQQDNAERKWTDKEVINLHIEIMKLGLIKEGSPRWVNDYEPKIREIATNYLTTLNKQDK